MNINNSSKKRILSDSIGLRISLKIKELSNLRIGEILHVYDNLVLLNMEGSGLIISEGLWYVDLNEIQYFQLLKK